MKGLSGIFAGKAGRGESGRSVSSVSRAARVAVLGLATVLSLTGCVKDRTGRGDIVTVGDQLPQFSVTMNDGTTVSTEDLRGSVSLIMFFYTECSDCQQVLPLVNQLYLEYGIGSGSASGDSSGSNSGSGSGVDSGDGFGSDSSDGSDSGDGSGVDSGSAGQVRFVLIGREQSYGTVLQYWLDNDYSVPFSAQTDRSVYNLFATNIVPRIYISDPSLTVRYTFDDAPDPTYQDLLSALLSLL